MFLERTAGPPYAASIIYHKLYLFAIFPSNIRGSTDPVLVVPAIPIIPIGNKLFFISFFMAFSRSVILILKLLSDFILIRFSVPNPKMSIALSILE